jgi:hypothetical protein
MITATAITINTLITKKNQDDCHYSDGHKQAGGALHAHPENERHGKLLRKYQRLFYAEK